MNVTFDFETRSPVNLKDCGVFVYAAHPATSIMCVSIAIDDQDPVIWIPDYFLQKIDTRQLRYRPISQAYMIDIVLSADKVVAHNSMFEFVIWNVVGRCLGWPPLPLESLHDTMAQCAYHALPLALDGATLALNLSVKKDAKGHSVMLKVSKNRIPRKAEKEADPQWWNKLWWHEEPEDLITLFNYCGTDVAAERLLYQTLNPLPSREREIWLMDQTINLRGLPIDRNSIQVIIDAVENRKAQQKARFQEVVKKEVSGPQSYVALKNWVNEQTGLNLTSVDKKVTAELLKTTLPAHVRKALEIKSELAKSSVAKFKAMINRACPDNRVRGTAQYHGAATGRWAARGVQPHNFPRDCYDETDFDRVTNLLKHNAVAEVRAFYADEFYAASRCIRGAICAPPGWEFVCADFSAVEGRKLAYLAGEKWVIDAYIAGKDMYKMAASVALGKPYEEITKDERQSPGKISELACFAGDTPVLTEYGWLPIKQVTSDIRIWDGREWVNQDGAIARGRKTVIDLCGVRVTPDHPVLVDGGKWVSAGGLNENIYKLKSAINTAHLRLPVPLTPRLGSTTTKKTAKVRTYDILNAGPRNRFMVLTDSGPMLAHNCGYGGGSGAVRNFGGGKDQTDEEIYAQIVTPWRQARPMIVGFWKGIERAAWAAVTAPGRIFGYRGIQYCVSGDFLLCQLPSGRLLHYYKPDIRPIVTPWGQVKDSITCMAMKVVDGKTTTQWARISTRGPKLVENIVQAACRDLLTEAMLRLEAAGYPIVLHVHDEAMALVPKGTADLKRFEQIMEMVPTWATGMPIKAAGWTGKRYRKD